LDLGASDEFRLTDSEGIVPLETIPLSFVIRLPLADLLETFLQSLI
jgi:hypothetical protein